MVIMVITIWRANKKPDNTSNVRDEAGDSESGNSNILPRPRHSSQTPKIAIHDHPIPRPAPGAEKLFSKKYISGIYFWSYLKIEMNAQFETKIKQIFSHHGVLKLGCIAVFFPFSKVFTMGFSVRALCTVSKTWIMGSQPLYYGMESILS